MSSCCLGLVWSEPTSRSENKTKFDRVMGAAPSFDENQRGLLINDAARRMTLITFTNLVIICFETVAWFVIRSSFLTQITQITRLESRQRSKVIIETIAEMLKNSNATENMSGFCSK